MAAPATITANDIKQHFNNVLRGNSHIANEINLHEGLERAFNTVVDSLFQHYERRAAGLTAADPGLEAILGQADKTELALGYAVDPSKSETRAMQEGYDVLRQLRNVADGIKHATNLCLAILSENRPSVDNTLLLCAIALIYLWPQQDGSVRWDDNGGGHFERTLQPHTANDAWDRTRTLGGHATVAEAREFVLSTLFVHNTYKFIQHALAEEMGWSLDKEFHKHLTNEKPDKWRRAASAGGRRNTTTAALLAFHMLTSKIENNYIHETKVDKEAKRLPSAANALNPRAPPHILSGEIYAKPLLNLTKKQTPSKALVAAAGFNGKGLFVPYAAAAPVAAPALPAAAATLPARRPAGLPYGIHLVPDPSGGRGGGRFRIDLRANPADTGTDQEARPFSSRAFGRTRLGQTSSSTTTTATTETARPKSALGRASARSRETGEVDTAATSASDAVRRSAFTTRPEVGDYFGEPPTAADKEGAGLRKEGTGGGSSGSSSLFADDV